MREVELKLLAPGPLDAARLAARVVSHVEERGARTLTATYYDTDDLRLARWGVTLRYRTGEGARGRWTLKLPDDGAIGRDEIDLAGGPAAIPKQAVALTLAYARAEPLRAVVKLRSRRRTWALLDGDAELAELADDEVAVMDGRRIASRFREIEIEARTATRNQLKAMAAALVEGGAVAAEPLPKAVRALGPAGQEPPDVPPPADVGPDAPAAAAVRAEIVDATRRIVHAHAPVVSGEPEGVHRMRVGARRLRSHLRTFAPLVDPEWVAWVTPELRWVGDALGKVRDLDVLVERLRRHARDETALTPLFERLGAERHRCRDELLAVVESGRYVALLVDLVARATDPPVADESGRPCSEIFPPLVAGSWESLAKAGRLLDSSDPEDDWHRVRIKAKRARYAAEAAARCLGPLSKDAREFALRCAAVQEVLGEHQDAVVARDTVVSLAKEIEADPAFHFAAGGLAEVEDRAAGAARDAFSRAWEALDRKKRRRWLA